MPIFTGQSEDGIGMRRAGVYIHPDGEQWGTEPFTREQKEDAKLVKLHDHIFSTIKNQKELMKEYSKIIHKESARPAKERAYIVNYVTDLICGDEE